MKCEYTNCKYYTAAGCAYEHIRKAGELRRLQSDLPRYRISKISEGVPHFSSPEVLKNLEAVLDREIRRETSSRLTRRHLETPFTI
jgi:hypothetical protein